MGATNARCHPLPLVIKTKVKCGILVVFYAKTARPGVYADCSATCQFLRAVLAPHSHIWQELCGIPWGLVRVIQFHTSRLCVGQV